MRIPYGFRFVFTWLISFGLAFFWLNLIRPPETDNSVLGDFTRILIVTSSILLGVIAVCSIIYFIGTRIFQFRIPVFVLNCKEWCNKVDGDSNFLFGATFAISSFIAGISLFKYFVINFLEPHEPLFERFVQNKNEFGKIPLAELIPIIGFCGILPFIIALLPPYISKIRQRLRENKTFRQFFMEGRGGSARWASISTYEKKNQEMFVIDTIGIDNHEHHGHLKSAVMLGKSLFSDDPLTRTIGIKDDAHMLTIGITGSGKSTTVLLPNLAMYKGSAIVLDPKGELANKTYRRRSNSTQLEDNDVKSQTRLLMSGICYVLDPFSETNGLPLSSYNLLSEIDINSDRSREMLSAIADGCVVPSGKDDAHFAEMARYFIEGVIAHVLSKYPKECHNLPFVFDLIHGIDTELKVADPTKFKELLYIMMKNDAAGGLPQQIAVKLLDMGDRERGSVLSTVARSLKWIGDPAMRKHLVKSDFKFSDIPHGTKTVYIVLPDGLINEQMRWLRSLISVSLGVLRNEPKPSTPTLFIMDEFPRLGGRIKAVAEGFGILRGYGIKLWAFIQDIGQIQQDYPERWSSMTANSTVQVFGVNDIKTAEWLSGNLGSAVQRRTDGREGFTKMYRKKVVSETANPLLTPNEVMNKFGKTTNLQVVMPTDGLPMRLERLAYKPLNFSGNKFRSYPLQFHFEDW